MENCKIKCTENGYKIVFNGVNYQILLILTNIKLEDKNVKMLKFSRLGRRIPRREGR